MPREKTYFFYFIAREKNMLTYTQAQMWCVGDKSTGCVVRGQEEEQELKEV